MRFQENSTNFMYRHSPGLGEYYCRSVNSYIISSVVPQGLAQNLINCYN